MTPFSESLGLLQDIDVRLTVELGRKQMRLRDVLALGENSIVELDRLTDDPLDILVNGKLIARGEVVAQGNRFAIRVLEVVGATASAAETSSDRRAPHIMVASGPVEEAL
jgi:flagellar motor switch protein FliN/FliY